MGGCCSDTKNEGMGPDEDNAELGELMRMQGGEEGSQALQLIIRCRNLRPLPNLNFRGIGKFGGTVPTHLLTHVNPYVVAYELRDTGEVKRVLGSTEVKARDLNPHFVRTIVTIYEFNAVSKEIRFDLLDSHGHASTVLGSATVTLSEIINSQPLTVPFSKEVESRGRHNETIKTTHKAGLLMITSEEVEKNEGPQYEVVMNVGCSQVDSKNYIGAGASDPFLTIGRIIEGQFQPMVKTEYVEGTLACEWKTIVVKLDKLCKSDFNAWLLFEVWDFENSGKHQLIGYTRQTLGTLLSGQFTEYDLVNDNYLGSQRMTAHGKVPYVRSGLLHMRSISIDISHSFLEFVKAGFDINVTICVDFSSSNGDTTDPDSLHYLNPSKDADEDNEYIQALKSVVKVLGQYDKDQEFPFYGFGACKRDDPNAKDSKGKFIPENIFPASGKWNEVTVNGIEGVIEAYWDCLKRIQPCEPTHFGHCLGNIFRSGSSRKDLYQIALVVTDGQCDDMEATIDIIVACSEAPISIIIIGVGDGPFDMMQLLSADDKPLKSSTKELMKRDIVGFVPYKQFQRDAESFARETLKEIPKQFTSWAKIHKVKPQDAKKESEEKARKEAERRREERKRRKEEEDEAQKRKSSEGLLDCVEDVDEAGWESFSDDETGRRYYFNSETKESKWEMPEGYSGRSAVCRSQEVKVKPISSSASPLSVQDVYPQIPDPMYPTEPPASASPSSSRLPYTRLGSGPQRKPRHSDVYYVPPTLSGSPSFSPSTRRGSAGFSASPRRHSLK